MKKTICLFSIIAFSSFFVIDYAFATNVSILEGTSSQPDCDDNNQCYDPYLLVIDVGETVTWTNNDSVPHTITSGNPVHGPDGKFDSGLIQSGESFSLKFESTQITAYFDMVHPWMQGIVRVIEGGPDEEIPEPEIIIEEPPDMSQPESDVCSSTALTSLMGPIHVINFKYTADSAKTFEKYKRSQGFEEYLLEIDYNKSQKVSNYVDSILASEEFAVFYFERDLSPEEEKLMIQVSEKYLEYLYDGKNELTLLMRTNYSEKKNEINAIPMQDSRITICGDDKIEGLEELEKKRRNMQLAIELYLEPIIEDWEKNLAVKQKSALGENFDNSEKSSLKNEVESSNKILSGEIGIKEGDWVKYKMHIEGEGGFGNLFETFGNVTDPLTGCTVEKIDWFKNEVIEINEDNVIFQTSRSCEGEVIFNDNILGDLGSSFIPIDVQIGDIIEYKEPYSANTIVTGFETKKIGSKTIDVIKAEKEEDYGSSLTTYTSKFYFDKKSGIMLESQHDLNMVNAPLVGNTSTSFGIYAIDFNIPRSTFGQIQTGNDNGGGCLIATATYGSELSAQVQQLRELRDNKLLQTESGSAFMESFNDFYYSFSPIIADYERENPIFKEAVKITLTPLLSSLSLLNYVDMDSEESVLVYGISLILLNVGMYFVAPMLIVWRIRNDIQNKMS